MYVQIIKTIFVSLIVYFLNGCGFTSELYSDTTYQEVIGGFLINENTNELIILGEEYHYIFESSHELELILKSERRSKIDPSFYSFHAQNDGTVNGYFELEYQNEYLTKEDQEWLNKNHFKKQLDKNEHLRFIFRGRVSGIRYLPNSEVNKKFEFNNLYSVTFSEERATTDKAMRTVLSPITLSMDGIIIVGLVGTGVVLCTIKSVTKGRVNNSIC